jgi:hypothetical protein
MFHTIIFESCIPLGVEACIVCVDPLMVKLVNANIPVIYLHVKINQLHVKKVFTKKCKTWEKLPI